MPTTPHQKESERERISNHVGIADDTAITPSQINVFVPYKLTPGTSANIQVQVNNILSAAVAVAVNQTAPGLSASVLNRDSTLNSASNPAPRGTIVSFLGHRLGSDGAAVS